MNKDEWRRFEQPINDRCEMINIRFACARLLRALKFRSLSSRRKTQRVVPISKCRQRQGRLAELKFRREQP
jgi:hypothetical protein